MPDHAPQLAPGQRIFQLEEIDSTNAEAIRLAHAGEAGPIWITARRQTRGRGRAGRTWVSEPGNLYASLLITPGCPPQSLHQLSLLAGVAVFDAIRTVAGQVGPADLRLKWPNDVLIGKDKLAGILPESLSQGSLAPTRAVIGIGINLAWHPTDLGREATHLAAHGAAVAPIRMLEALADRTDHWLERWLAGQAFADIRSAWLERAGAIGERLSINTGAGPISGQYAGIDQDGALLLRDAGDRLVRYTHGDVVLMTPAEATGKHDNGSS